MLKEFKVDLHIHTCLSSCADPSMFPRRIVKKAVETGIDIIGICDHNSGENVRAAIASAQGKNITVLPGIEITSAENVHILSIFDEIAPVLLLQEIIYEHLPPGNGKKDVSDKQVVIDEFDRVEGHNTRWLSGPTSLTLKEVAAEIHALGGLAIAAHVDRDEHSILGQYGFIPGNLELDALEISITSPSHAVEIYPGIQNFPLITSSDAHELDHIGSDFSWMLLEAPTFDEIQKAFERRSGRTILYR